MKRWIIAGIVLLFLLAGVALASDAAGFRQKFCKDKSLPSSLVDQRSFQKCAEGSWTNYICKGAPTDC